MGKALDKLLGMIEEAQKRGKDTSFIGVPPDLFRAVKAELTGSSSQDKPSEPSYPGDPRPTMPAPGGLERAVVVGPHGRTEVVLEA